MICWREFHLNLIKNKLKLFQALLCFSVALKLKEIECEKLKGVQGDFCRSKSLRQCLVTFFWKIKLEAGLNNLFWLQHF